MRGDIFDDGLKGQIFQRPVQFSQLQLLFQSLILFWRVELMNRCFERQKSFTEHPHVTEGNTATECHDIFGMYIGHLHSYLSDSHKLLAQSQVKGNRNSSGFFNSHFPIVRQPALFLVSLIISESLLLLGCTFCPPSGQRFRKEVFVTPPAKLNTYPPPFPSLLPILATYFLLSIWKRKRRS